MQRLVRANTNISLGIYRIDEVFEGLSNIKILEEVYGSRDRLNAVLNSLKVKVVDEDCYMYVDDKDASIVVSLKHLKCSDQITLHLDIIHELVHIKQLLDGKELYDHSRSYVDRDTEIEAYRIAIKEARNLGLDDKQILDYLYVEWISKEELNRLAYRLGIKLS